MEPSGTAGVAAARSSAASGMLGGMNASQPARSAGLHAAPAPTALSPTLRRRVAVRLLPYLFVIYVIAFLDRVNISYATLGMTRELGFTAQVMGWGMGIFFFGYFLLEVPSTLLVERWSARKWMARIMVSWGLIAIALGFVHSARAFYLGRFLLGAAEAGFFPGLIVYLGHWFSDRDKAKAVALFMAALPVSFILGSPLSGAILGVHWLGLSGWRWVFILEGLPAIVCGVLNLWLLTDWPAEADWLEPAERAALQAAITGEKAGKPSHLAAWGYLQEPAVLILSLVYLLICSASYGFGLWLPTMLKHVSGLPNMSVTLLSALPYLVCLVCMVVLGWTSDRSGERRWHTAVPLWVMAAGLSIGGLISVHGLGWILAGFCLAGAGVYSYMPSFWALPAGYLSGTAAAVAIGVINSIGNLGGFVGPYMMGYIRTHTGSFTLAMAILVAMLLLAGGLVFTLPRPADRAAAPAAMAE